LISGDLKLSLDKNPPADPQGMLARFRPREVRDKDMTLTGVRVVKEAVKT